jgi:hypothetical protein
MTRNKLIVLLALSTTVFTACQIGQPAERPLNTDGRPRVIKPATPVEEVLPVLKVSQKGQNSEFKLRSQTSRYLNDLKTELEITLSSSSQAYCQNEAPVLKEGEEQLKITIKAKDGKTAITKAEFAGNEAFEIFALRKTATLETKIPAESFESLKISDLNNAIVRGSLRIASEDLKMEGEYFTAICK